MNIEVLPVLGASSSRRGFTLPELLTAIVAALVLLFLVAAVILPSLGPHGRDASPMKNSSQLRGIHQGMVIYADSNNGFLPGLNASGETVADGPETGFSGDSTTAAARMWVLLNGQFFTGELAINPKDHKRKWAVGAVTKDNFSYAMLSIADTAAERGRREEWKDNANSQALLMSDRALRTGLDAGAGVPDRVIRSVWTTASGDWKGNVVWGDNHAGLEQSHKNFQTRYVKATATGDNLFADGDENPAGASEPGTTPGANAFMIYN